MLHYHFIIRGDVQGVGFRYFTQKNASLYGINGWVRNKIDGTVEIDAEGSETNMTEFIKDVERGNRYSLVESINTEKLSDMEYYKSFHIIEDG